MYCIILNSPVLYSAVQYRVPPLYKNDFFFFAFLDESDHFQCFPKGFRNKLKSLKVAQVKDEMDDEEDDGCEGVHDVAW